MMNETVDENDVVRWVWFKAICYDKRFRDKCGPVIYKGDGREFTHLTDRGKSLNNDKNNNEIEKR